MFSRNVDSKPLCTSKCLLHCLLKKLGFYSPELPELVERGRLYRGSTPLLQWLPICYAYGLLLLLTGPRPSPEVGNRDLLCNPEPNLSSHLLVHRHV